MTSFKYDATRAVEIWPAGKGFGTGYRIADRLILTAKHIFNESSGDTCEIRCHKGDQNNKLGKVNAKVVWCSSDCDVALIEILQHEHWDAGLLSTRFAHRKDFKNEKSTPFRMFCFPGVLQYKNGESIDQGGHSEDGTIQWDDYSGQKDHSIPIRPDSLFNSKSDQSSPWQGGSGASVFCSDRCLGVLKKHINPEYQQKLNVEDLSLVFDDPEWKAWLAKFELPNYGDNNISFTPKEELLDQLKELIAGELRKVDSVPVFQSLKYTLNENDPKTEEHDVACMICDYVKPNSLIKLIDDVLQPAIANVKVIQQANGFLIVDSAVNKSFRELLRLLLPLSLDDYLEIMQNERADNAHQIYKFAVTTPLGVEIMAARIQDGRVSLSHDDTVQSISGVGAIPIDNPVFAKEEDAKIVSKVLIELWKKVIPEEKPQGTELTIREKNKLSGIIRRRKKFTNHYCISSLANVDFDRFKSLAALLCREIPSLSAIAYGGLNNDALIYFEDDLIVAISELTKNLEKEFPSGSV